MNDNRLIIRMIDNRLIMRMDVDRLIVRRWRPSMSGASGGSVMKLAQ